VFRAVFTNRKKSGEFYDEAKTITPLRNEQGAITHFVSTGKDITEYRRAEAALRASEQHLQMILDVAADAVYDWDVHTGLTRWNHGQQSLFGYAGDHERTHAWWRQHVHPDDLPQVVASLEETIQQGAPLWSCEYRYRLTLPR
jgi:PAS domain-containing protein